MNSPFGLGTYLGWWNQQNRVYKQSFIILLTGIILKCPCTSKPFWSQSRDILLLLLKNIFCTQQQYRKEHFSYRWKRTLLDTVQKWELFLHIWHWLGSTVYPVKGMQEGEGRLERKRRTWNFPMYNQESSLHEISSQKPQVKKISSVETMYMHTVFTATTDSIILCYCSSASQRGDWNHLLSLLDSRVYFSYKQEVLLLKGPFITL